MNSALQIYSKAVPKATYQDIEIKMREENFKIFLTGLEKVNAEVITVTCPHNSYVEFGQWRTLFHNLLGDFVLSDRFALCRPHKRWNAGHWDLCLINQLGSSILTVTHQEVVQVFGRSPKLIHYSLCPIHIIMERSTGKTVCAFAEFDSYESAKEAVDRVNGAHDSHTGPRIGNRHVDVTLSSQEELLRAHFPMAK
ncbi:hypothetical protein PENDEC_c003G06200 [Penicillium decumbens]|uniref:RRM domain-containing protein n=1 Tax=Penicillium decumbens TaxID=69771 RepID=A0A1V6PJR4_PENDC|nr:hypothetical protein PENDEC_c003G06200 [Penicillium decumbens]